MDGRMYHIWSTESYDTYYYDEEIGAYLRGGVANYDVRKDLPVSNGTWVMERTLGFGYSWTIGAPTEKVDYVVLDRRMPDHQPFLYSSSKPFGFVWSEDAGYLPGTHELAPKGPRRLSYARQINKGELGGGIPIPKLKTAREHPSVARKYHDFPRNRSQRRNPFRWARLDDVVAASGISAYPLLKGYWPFLGRSHVYDTVNQRGGILLHARFGDTKAEIEAQTQPHSFLTFEELGQYIMAGNLDNVWIRDGFAKTMLRLRALGYEPVATSIPNDDPYDVVQPSAWA